MEVGGNKSSTAGRMLHFLYYSHKLHILAMRQLRYLNSFIICLNKCKNNFIKLFIYK